MSRSGIRFSSKTKFSVDEHSLEEIEKMVRETLSTGESEGVPTARGVAEFYLRHQNPTEKTYKLWYIIEAMKTELTRITWALQEDRARQIFRVKKLVEFLNSALVSGDGLVTARDDVVRTIAAAFSGWAERLRRQREERVAHDADRLAAGLQMIEKYALRTFDSFDERDVESYLTVGYTVIRMMQNFLNVTIKQLLLERMEFAKQLVAARRSLNSIVLPHIQIISTATINAELHLQKDKMEFDMKQMAEIDQMCATLIGVSTETRPLYVATEHERDGRMVPTVELVPENVPYWVQKLGHEELRALKPLHELPMRPVYIRSIGRTIDGGKFEEFRREVEERGLSESAAFERVTGGSVA